MNLTHLHHGDHAIVTAIEADDPSLAARFAARGIVPGIQIGVLRSGNPLLIGVDSDRWAINEGEASHIQVDLIKKPKRSLLAFLLGS